MIRALGISAILALAGVAMWLVFQTTIRNSCATRNNVVLCEVRP